MLPGICVAGGPKRATSAPPSWSTEQPVGQGGDLGGVADVVVVVAGRVVDDTARVVLRDGLRRCVDAEEPLVRGPCGVADVVGVATGHLDDEELADLLLQRHVTQERVHPGSVGDVPRARPSIGGGHGRTEWRDERERQADEHEPERRPTAPRGC
jgi:hypothetical protein